MTLDPRRTALVAIDMHRGHLDPAVATLPLPAERCPGVIARARELFTGLRGLGVPVVHVVTKYRDPAETLANPFWNAITDDPTKKRSGNRRHNVAGMPGTEIIPELLEPFDFVVDTKKRYSPFLHTDLEFLLSRRLAVDTVILAGINTTTCVLCAAFEATNRDFRVVVAADAVDSMDGEEMHRFALRLTSAALGWPLGTDEIVRALGA
jgi:biuret amidohydrolase